MLSKLNLVLLIFSFMFNDYYFNNKQEFELYCEENKKLLWEMPEISSDRHIYMYNAITRDIFKFDNTIEKGWKYEFFELRPLLLKEEIELRDVLARKWGGIQLSRSNYLLEKQRIQKIEKHIDFYNAILTTKLGIKDFDSFDDSIWDSINLKLRKMTPEELMAVEVPLMIYIMQYAQKKYDSEFKVVEKENQFKEVYHSIDLIFKHNNQSFSLGSDVFRSLFPDFERDYFEKEEDVVIDITTPKNLIDFFHKQKIVPIHD